MPKLAFVFAPGAWHPANSFDNVTTILTEQGYDCHSIAFPSVTRVTEIKDALLTEDIATIRSVIEALVDAGRDVVLIMHSWAGVPCCSGLKGLTRVDRQEKGLDGGVGYLFFISSFFGNMGDNLLNFFFTEMNINWWVVNVRPSSFFSFVYTMLDDLQKETKTLFSDDPIYRFYFGLPAAEALKRAAALWPHALLSMGVPAAGAAWLEVPSTYLICTEDNALTLEFQREMVNCAQAEGANMRTVKMKTGHSPWLVDVGVFVGHLLDAVNTGI